MSGHRPRCVSDSSLRVQPIADQPSPGSTLPGFFRFQNPGRVLPGLERASSRRDRRTGFTLVEMMVAVGLTVLMMTMVVTIFGLVMDGIRDSRGAIEVTDRLRAAKTRLQLDLMELTAPLTPPLDPAMGLGYFEYIEGPIGPVVSPADVANSDNPNAPQDSTVGDIDDMLMFTVNSNDEPFVGRAPVKDPSDGRWKAVTVQSYTAEIVWFVRGNVLHRRTLLVYPNLAQLPTFNEFNTYLGTLGANEYHPKSIYEFCDISLHVEGDPASAGDLRPVPNTLNDLTNRENRYGHQAFAWPHDARFWGGLGLPTTEEFSSGVFNCDLMNSKNSIADPIGRLLFFPKKQADGSTDFGLMGITDTINPAPRLYLPTAAPFFDAWIHPNPSTAQDSVTGQIIGPNLGTRIGEDVILTNVIGFDVKVWDPGAPIITLNDTTSVTYPSGQQVPNGEGILPTDAKFAAPPDGTVQKIAIAATLDRLNEVNGGADLDQIVGYGAYVDLNYMCRLGVGTYTAPFDTNTALDTIVASTGQVLYPSFLNDQNTSLQDRSPPAPQFHHHGDMRSGLFGTFPIDTLPTDPDVLRETLRASVYDTFSTAYENDEVNQADVPWNPARIVGDPVLPLRSGVNGLDDNSNGAIDESSAWPNISTVRGSPSPPPNAGFAGEKETAPPYPHPLRGIQVKIRVFEPATRQIREVTLEHEVVTQ